MWILTLTQPYAWMVIHGPKDIENRSWVNQILLDLIRERMPFGIHAGKEIPLGYYHEAVAYAKSQDPDLVVPAREELVRGCVLGTVVPTSVYAPAEWTPKRRWHMKGQQGWQLSERKPLSYPVLAKGKQGFWTFPDDEIGRAA